METNIRINFRQILARDLAWPTRPFLIPHIENALLMPVCVYERERECVCVCVREREGVCVRERHRFLFQQGRALCAPPQRLSLSRGTEREVKRDSPARQHSGVLNGAVEVQDIYVDKSLSSQIPNLAHFYAFRVQVSTHQGFICRPHQGFQPP